MLVKSVSSCGVYCVPCSAFVGDKNLSVIKMHCETIKINLSTVICSDNTSPFVVQYQLYIQYTCVHNFTSEYGNM
jgi:hypothetical protein